MRMLKEIHVSYCISLLCIFILTTTVQAQQDTVSLKWLDGGAPPVASGVSWGVPWQRGLVSQDQEFALTTPDGKSLPLQTWSLAYWPDGSIKWSGFATIADVETPDELKLVPTGSDAQENHNTVQVTEDNQSISIDTGAMQCLISKTGSNLIESITMDGRVVARDGHLVCVLQDGPESDVFKIPQRETFTSKINQVTVEQDGPVRAVVKIEGMHKLQSGSREWLPFSVRFYFFAGTAPVRMVHSVVYDGNEQTDFIRGLGIVFSVPMREEIHNRHVRFSGQDGGLWSEPIQPMIGRGGRYVNRPGERRDLYPDQLEGKRVPNKDEVDDRGQNLLSNWAVWDDFRLLQPNANGFTIEKRTNPQSSWIPAGAGKRASGLVFAGDVSGGLAVGLKDFWQSYPSSLEVRRAASDAAELRVWLWSPDAPAMDMRHYDIVAHGLEEVYEDVQEGFSTPHGVARTSELTLFPSASVPTIEETARQAETANQPPLLVCAPEYYHSVKAFGIWSLPDRSTPLKQTLEDELDDAIAYYQTAIDQHNWYGFWDYGDVMHSYDADRHVWRYDLGGMAWDNSELGTDMWLWYSFLRTGKADIFRMAEAMTRHTGEVDCYHLGRFAGLGSRHNVRHWGCGAKEARISQAPYRRYYYYLTTDERIGDIMREMLVAETKIVEIDPMRIASPITESEKEYPGRVRGGPDWLALAGNWMTEWERTGDTKWRDKIYAGMDSIAGMQYGFRTGENLLWGYDPESYKLYPLTDVAGNYNLTTIMGGAEVVFELNDIVDHNGWQKAWLQYCRLYSAPGDVIEKDMETGTEGNDGQYSARDRLAAYAYMKTGNKVFADIAVRSLTRRGFRGNPVGSRYDTQRVEGPEALNPLDEAARVSTNNAAQSSLTTIQILEMCADQLPETLPEPDEQGNNPRRTR